MGNITLTLDDGLIKRLKKIAVEKDTTLTGNDKRIFTGYSPQR